MVLSTPKEAGPERESLFWRNGHLGGCQHYQLPTAPPISGRKDHVLGVKGSLVSGLLHVAHLLRLLLEGGQFGAWLTVKMCVYGRGYRKLRKQGGQVGEDQDWELARSLSDDLLGPWAIF